MAHLSVLRLKHRTSPSARPGSGTMWRAVALSLLLGILAFTCNQPFDPRAPLQEQIVLFSILSTDRDKQFVTVNRNYMPDGYDPNEFAGNTFVSNAFVSISGPSISYVLRDTLFPRSDTSRYRFPIQAYYAAPFVPHYDSSYQVFANSPDLQTASGTTVIPGKANLTAFSSTQAILRLPENYPNDALIELKVQSQGTGEGYVARMYVYYDVLKGGQWVEERVEIPVSSVIAQYSMTGARYPILTRRPISGNLTVFFRNGFYRVAVDDVGEVKYPVGGLIFKWVVFTFLQVDQNLFNYYNVTHQYRDPLTVRLDEPTYSTVQGGIGLVGSYTLDSLTYVLPEKFYANH